MKKLRVLVGCEFSGIVRDAFRALGHDAWSCDLLPCDGDPQYHRQGDVFKILNEPFCGDNNNWDLFIFHWPCTRLCNSGVRWLFGGKGNVRDESRWAMMERDAQSFKLLLDCGVAHIAGENPIPHKYAKEIMGDYSQTIQPWQFGHGETKRTCLWLKNLPSLKPTSIVDGREQRIWKLPPSADRWKERSKTFPGIAKAMAEQWSEYICNL